MRLIDADRLKEVIDKTFYGIHCSDGIAAMHLTIDEQPTAFNKEKVIKELAIRKEIEDEKAAAFDEAGDIYNMEMRDNISLAFRAAMNIVKRGGIDG